MVILNPLIVIIGMIIYLIPYLWPVSFAITMFVYHILLKNRDEHIKRLKKIFETKGIKNYDFGKIKEKDSLKVLFGYIISFLGFTLIFLKLSNQIEKIYSQITSLEELQNLEYSLPQFDTFLFILFLFFLWVTYINLLNKIIKDQFFIQNMEIINNVIDKPVIKYRDSNFIMFLRIITFNLYEWFLLISLIRETNTLYIKDGTYNIKTEEHLEEKNIDNNIDNNEELVENNFETREEYLSYLYSVLSQLNSVKRIKKMEELVSNNKISEEEAEKLKKMF
ncbi:hypothetical protein [Marinitoga sp. 38H-ov]|uniref:hypothetical protein n=1 Tax=Marinitoga sp. 38H-ov TaxID=1755814 RepID=UPI0013EA4BC8|nr:hypothetical protein [Marinitoga sp. 38H-ov]KAF2956516.1 hypothetical protein AS160_05670 [Marinitoga sp. 38H-ov]